MARRPGPALTFNEVLEAAIEVVQTQGPDALGVSAVARALGIKPPSIYSHVGKGDALALAVSIEGNRRLVGVLKTAVRGVVPPREQLLTLAHATRKWALRNAGLYAVMARVPPPNEHPAFAPVLQDFLDLFARPLGQLGLIGDAAIHAIRGLRATVHGFVLLETGGQFGLTQQPEHSFVWAIEALIDGLAKVSAG